MLAAILRLANTENFTFPVDMFDDDALLCQLPVVFLLLFGQRLLFRSLVRYLGARKCLLDALKTAVSFDGGLLV